MTRKEAEATAIVLRWACNQKPHAQPEQVREAMLVLARGAERHGKISEGNVKKWTA